ncbi:hypothetical protein A2223_04395 [Candidatus Falkowbacteria bacterium RIFOXYA2_FULL_35_8]|uniref:Phosphate propanoyltransferase n=1 Tax=Candidatus Falkowbacteria bacterium RIFOXYC2_FULL_36_12 TaxID=1798002 RepID=A0A1F5SYF5_9BACT|nr:MAG: hypothetical protein A2300_01390 [Candidatus Falkowbacteria bacterium RIFOXYB2_FULL_35_7]OGF31744.1 MAG: hypothetical protein A2478_04635 [Candidatus Falkowbacteria bacterium RIFOXYC2_FULL_36_12]OGF34077.1 MAG: hypothetical protein A2223_04395 [Candidatus Falkowbacteria bacterium RIFOXYA2_FULL_35_8]
MLSSKIEVSARHLHITQQDLEKLFGPNFVLIKHKDLSQFGEFSSTSRVSLVGPKGQIDDVRIVGPCRGETQVEIAKSDAILLGINAPLRLSGKLEGSGSLILRGPKGELNLEKGVIVAKRHLHISTDEAMLLGLKSGQDIKIRIISPREVIYDRVEVRTAENYNKVVHLDTDEANAAGVDNETEADLII